MKNPVPSSRRLALSLLLVASSLAGCGERDAAASTTAPAERPPEPVALEPVPAERSPDRGRVADPAAPDPLLDPLMEAPTPEEEAAAAEAMPEPLAPRAAPARGCALQSEAPQRVLTAAGPPAIVAHDDGFLVAAYEQSSLRVVRVRPGALPEPIASIPIDGAPPREAAPGMALTDAHEVLLALLDGRGRVLSARFDPSLPASAPVPREVAASGADTRFSPAVRAVGSRRVVAWTDGSATPMRLRLAVLENERVVGTHDVTPTAGGGAAPAFVEGSGEPWLLFLDPRVGISVAHRVRLGADGTPGATEVARPLNLAAEPPAIAAARANGSSRTWLAYAAVGNLATRAVGLVDAAGTEMPAPLVPGVGYGDPLALDAIVSGGRVVFAVEAPSGADRSAPHEIRLRVVDDAGAGDPVVVPAPATEPALARGADGLLAIAYRSGSAVLLHFARCAE